MNMHIICFVVLAIQTFNILNCFKDHKSHIHILKCILDLAWPKWMELVLEQQYMFVLHCEHRARWCSAHFKRQCINSHGIEPQSWNISSPTSEGLIHNAGGNLILITNGLVKTGNNSKCLAHWPLGDVVTFKNVISEPVLWIKFMSLCYSQVIATEHSGWHVSIGSGNCFVPQDKKP